jgi:hypothetical protein
MWQFQESAAAVPPEVCHSFLQSAETAVRCHAEKHGTIVGDHSDRRWITEADVPLEQDAPLDCGAALLAIRVPAAGIDIENACPSYGTSTPVLKALAVPPADLLRLSLGLRLPHPAAHTPGLLCLDRIRPCAQSDTGQEHTDHQ